MFENGFKKSRKIGIDQLNRRIVSKTPSNNFLEFCSIFYYEENKGKKKCQLSFSHFPLIKSNLACRNCIKTH